MLKTIITDAIVSPGYEGAPALKFSEKGDAARFRIGKKVYDPKEDDNQPVDQPVREGLWPPVPGAYPERPYKLYGRGRHPDSNQAGRTAERNDLTWPHP